MASLTTQDETKSAFDVEDASNEQEESVFDEKELRAIQELRGILKPLYKDDEWFSDYLDDSTLWRYLTARDMNIDKARDMFITSTTWKRENKLKQKKQEYLEQKTRWSRIAKRVFYGGVAPKTVQTKNGGPVAFERLGRIDLGGFYRHEDEFQAALNGYMLYLEDCWNAVRAHPGTKKRALIINDASGLSLSFLWYVKTFKRIVDVGPSNFPEVTYKVIIVNAPSAVSAIWAVVSAFLPAATKAKVMILGSMNDVNVMKIVCNELKNGQKDLPDYLGGDTHYNEDILPRAGTVDDAMIEVAAMEENDEVKKSENEVKDEEYENLSL
jgi:hypothetical protein